MTDCIFCRIVAGEIPAKVVAQDELALAFEDLNPQAPTHVLVIPKHHVRDIKDEWPAGLLEAVFALANRVAEERGVTASGYRAVFNYGPDAGQTVFHAHLHLLGGRPLGWPPG